MKGKSKNTTTWLLGILGFILIVAIIASNTGVTEYDSRTEDNIDPTSKDLIDSTEATAIRGNTSLNSTRSLLENLGSVNVEKDSFDKLLRKARKDDDEFQEVSFYYDPTTVKYTNYNSIHCYISKAGADVNLRFRLQYNADDWLFIERVIFNIDGENFPYTPQKMDRDNGDGAIWEWFDETVGEEELIILKKLSTAKSAKVKLIGSQYHDIKTITKSQKAAIKNILMLYKGFQLGYDK